MASVLADVGAMSFANRALVRLGRIGGAHERTVARHGVVAFERARHYWDGSQALGEALSPTLGIRAKMAWDVYVVYDEAAEWGPSGNPPPQPLSWLHQKPGEDEALELDEERLVEQLREALKMTQGDTRCRAKTI